MLISDLLLEMPRNLLHLNKLDDLSQHSVNKAKFIYLIKQEKKELKQINTTQIIYNSNKMFFCLDLENKKVLYYMQYDTSFSNTLGSFLWQSLVWRDKHSPQVKLLPHKIFFEELLPKYGIIATDGDQTEDGRRFWEYQIAHALENNINVFYFNLTSKELQSIKTLVDFDKAIRKFDIWGDTKEHQQKLMLITTKNL